MPVNRAIKNGGEASNDLSVPLARYILLLLWYIASEIINAKRPRCSMLRLS